MKAIRRVENEARRSLDKSARATTTIRTTRTQSVFVAPTQLLLETSGQSVAGDETAQLQIPDHDYICKSEFTEVHHFYDMLCPTWGGLLVAYIGPERLHSLIYIERNLIFAKLILWTMERLLTFGIHNRKGLRLIAQPASSHGIGDVMLLREDLPNSDSAARNLLDFLRRPLRLHKPR